MLRSGFYSVRLAAADRDPLDDEAYAVAILAHLKDQRFVGVDQGGCRLFGSYADEGRGSTAVSLRYQLKAGSHLINGMVLDQDTVVEGRFLLDKAAEGGAPQRVDIGLGPMFLRLEWLADPA